VNSHGVWYYQHTETADFIRSEGVDTEKFRTDPALLKPEILFKATPSYKPAGPHAEG
jgi:hypothetical protein